MMREADSTTAAAEIDSIAARNRALDIALAPHRRRGCTFSGGVAEYRLHGASGHALRMRADTARYAAKVAGRDRGHSAGCPPLAAGVESSA